ncbi:toxin-antitoxin system YwqK family antitoxin [Verrucomicrobia bacterium]|nr:toxin-antitoxin system YwqK family antitoxin [Verrucomicrobiota bacterium]
MKPVLLSLAIALLMVGWGEVVDYEKLQDRGGVMYLPNEETPFTGRAESFHENGQKSDEINFKDGKWDGLRTAWYPNGQKYLSCNYEDGKTTSFTRWYENGQKSTEGFDYSRNQHKEISWYKNGQKSSEVIYRDGKPDKPISAKVWKPNGEKCTLTNLKDGNGIKASYSDDRTWQSFYSTYKDGKIVGYQDLQTGERRIGPTPKG